MTISRRTFLYGCLGLTAALLGGSFLFSSWEIGQPKKAMAATVPIRGIVEGFYGTPWTQKQRVDMLAFCQKQGLNAYIYAPKDDVYERKEWRSSYPAAEQKNLSYLVQTAEKNQLYFIYALSPGLDLHLQGDEAQADREAARKKLQSLYDIGVRQFAIFFDDIDNKDGLGQAEFINWLDDNFVKTHPDVKNLVTVPTEYFYQDMQHDGTSTDYTAAFAKNLHDDVYVLYTGDKVVSDGLSDESYAVAKNLYGRPLSLWWNYPVTDYMENKLALGPIDKLPAHAEIPAIFYNPMKFPEASKIALATGADYANNMESYDAQTSWQKAIQQQYGDLATDMQLFAAQSQHLENSWAKVGRPDDPELAQAVQEYLEAKPDERAEAEQVLLPKLDRLDEATEHLLAKLPPETLQEMQPQLLQLHRIIVADKLGMQLVKLQDATGSITTPQQAAQINQFYRQYNACKAEDKNALISETGARALLTGLHDKLTE